MFSKSKAILYVHKNGVSFYVDKDSAGLQFDFNDTVKGLEVKKQEELQSSFAAFVKENFPEPLKAVLLLSEEIVLEKSILAKDSNEQRIEIQKFLDDVKFKNIGRLLYKMSGILQVVAANKDLYEEICSVLVGLNWSVEAVVPVRIFGQFETNNILSKENLEDILKKQDLIKEGNLLEDAVFNNDGNKNAAVINSEEIKEEKAEKKSEKPVADGEKSKNDDYDTNPFASEAPLMYKTKKSSFPFKSVFVVIIVAIIFFALGFGALQVQPWKHIPGLSALHPTPTAVPTSTPTPTPTPQPLAKSKLQIEVLNGTGKVGQAGDVKALLEKDDYTNITTDNASSTDNTTTTVSFSSSVSPTDRDTIKKDLSAMFQTVSVDSSSPTGNNNVVITTGTEK